MSWAEKELKKYKLKKEIDRIMNSPEYKEMQKRDERRIVLHAFARFCYIGCEYLELKHRYGKRGLLDWLDFAKVRIVEIAKDDTYYTDVKKYYEEYHCLDVLEVLGLCIKSWEEEE